MEDPYLRTEYEARLHENGVSNRMDPSWYEKPAGGSKGEVVAAKARERAKLRYG